MQISCDAQGKERSMHGDLLGMGGLGEGSTERCTGSKDSGRVLTWMGIGTARRWGWGEGTSKGL